MTTKSFDLATIMPFGGQISAALLLRGNPTSATEAADKNYVDTTIAAIGGIPEAPLSTTVSYGRLNATWTPVLALTGGTLTGPLVLNADPGAPLGAATKQYVDTKAGAYLPLLGGTMAGPLVLAADPAIALGAATRQYVDNNFLKLAGGTLSGFLTLNADPVTPLEAATKNYVDTHAASGGLGDAPSNGTTYGRLNGAWVSVLNSTGGTVSGGISGAGAGVPLDNFNIDAGTF